MSVADHLTYTSHDTAIVSCDHCDRDNVATIWSDSRTGEWGYEFDCIYCGEPNAREYDRGDRGAAQAVFLLKLCAGFVMLLGILGASWLIFSLGLLAFAAPVIIRAAHAADARKGQNP